eukprot:1654722-Pyramimonas_sp.AAC.1
MFGTCAMTMSRDSTAASCTTFSRSTALLWSIASKIASVSASVSFGDLLLSRKRRRESKTQSAALRREQFQPAEHGGQSREGREHIPRAGANHGRGGSIYPRSTPRYLRQ